MLSTFPATFATETKVPIESKISTKNSVKTTVSIPALKALDKSKNIVIGFGITEKTIKSLKKADGLVVGSAICKEITKSLNNRQKGKFSKTEIKLKGFKPGNEEWLPAIEAHAAGANEIYEVLSSRGEAFSLAGSGDYRNYFEIDGARYSHEIDPRTGRPVTHDLAAAFVITESAAEADALATAFMILGLEESKSVTDQHSISAFLISRVNENHFEHFVTSTFAQYVLKLSLIHI